MPVKFLSPHGGLERKDLWHLLPRKPRAEWRQRPRESDRRTAGARTAGTHGRERPAPPPLSRHALEVGWPETPPARCVPGVPPECNRNLETAIGSDRRLETSLRGPGTRVRGTRPSRGWSSPNRKAR